MDQIVHDVRRQNWLNIMEQCQNRPSGSSVKNWLSENGISEKSYYYWQRKFRNEAFAVDQLPAVSNAAEITFAEMPLPVSNHVQPDVSSCTITIRKKELTVEISNDVSTPLLSALIKELAHA